MQESIKTKICSKCQVKKSAELFFKDKTRKDGLRSSCKECDKACRKTNREKYAERGKKYRQANAKKIADNFKVNKEKYAEHQKAYYQENRDMILERVKKYREENRKIVLERKKAYYQTPMGKAVRKNTNHKRRSITKQGDVTSAQLLDLTTNAKVCYWCGVSLKGKKVHIDHYVPLAKGGEHTLSNLVISCSHCNLVKNAKDPIEFAQSIGKLF